MARVWYVYYGNPFLSAYFFTILIKEGGGGQNKLAT